MAKLNGQAGDRAGGLQGTHPDQLSGHGLKILEALADGRVFRLKSDGWRAGALRAPPSLIGDLSRAALLREDDDGLALTDMGRARIRWTARPARLLAERALPEPADASTLPRRPRRSVTVNVMESPLGWLHARGLIEQRQFDAGERLRGDFTMAGLGARVTMRWDAAPASTRRAGPDAPLDPTLAGIAAKRRFEGAIAAAGTGMGDILWRVVCSGDGLEAAEAALGWPKRAGKLVLLMALDRVADYYGLQ
ncbi:DUF6456 domain-containing protein [uncultured Sphingomonas sp.]|uniref:DUF6456 domain-containing protein n=1 Tax=uncultured Sphingomonas sp. TaxID=158754 RepID=UPI00344EEFED